MSLFKKKLTEQEAASHFVIYITKKVQGAWPGVYKSLQDSFGDKFVVEDEIMASYDLALAAIAENLQAVKNVFPKDQAERIEKWVSKVFDAGDWREYSVDEIKKYGEKFRENPLGAVSSRLLCRWLGNNIRNFEVEFLGKKTGTINQLLVMMTAEIISNFIFLWEKLKDDFDIVEGDIPFDENLNGLKDYVPEPDEIKPPGTFQYYDEDGSLKEKWLPPELFDELLKKGGAKEIYRVLVKGPWDGVKETFFKLSDDDVKNFVDEKNYAYATCSYKKGKLEYVLTKKKLWDSMEEVGKILLNDNLSKEQQVEEIKKLAED